MSIPTMIKWDIRQRLAMLEATALWEGRVTTAALTLSFGISRGQASKDFSLYHQLAPENLLYDTKQKAYFPSDTFNPRFIRGTAEEYLRLIESGHELGVSVTLPIMPSTISVDVLRVPERKLDLHVLRILNQAIRNREQIRAVYQSMSREPRELKLEPHSLVHNGFRWHVRAYSYEHDEYRDFVLARFLSRPTAVESAQHFQEDDREWNSFETWVIKPNSELSEEQQSVIAEDYGMRDGELHMTVRKAMGIYYRRILHLDDVHGPTPRPEAKQIVLANVDCVIELATSREQ